MFQGYINTKLMVVNIFIAAGTTLPLNKHEAMRVFKSG